MGMTVNNVFRNYGAYKTNSHDTATARTSRANENTDSEEIRKKAKDFSTVLNAVSSAPDLRPEKVQDIKTRVDMGRYDVSSSAVANKMLGSIYNIKL